MLLLQQLNVTDDAGAPHPHPHGHVDPPLGESHVYFNLFLSALNELYFLVALHSSLSLSSHLVFSLIGGLFIFFPVHF